MFCNIVKVVAILQSNWHYSSHFPLLKIMQGVNHKFIFVFTFVEFTVPWQDWKQTCINWKHISLLPRQVVSSSPP